MNQHLLFMTENEKSALIRLLDDPDKNVYSAVEKRIMDEGESMIEPLERAWACNEDNLLLQKRVEELVPIIENNAMLKLFMDWASHPDSLLKAAWLMSKLLDFKVSEEVFTARYNELKIHLFQYGFSNYSPLEHIKIMNFIFFRKMGFKPCKTDDFTRIISSSPLCVLDEKAGTPESLALMYLMYARDAGLPIVGVNLPKNFVLAYHDDLAGTRFYINPTTCGSVFYKSEIDSFLKNIKLPQKMEFYKPCDNITIVQRLLLRLEFSYKYNNRQKEADLVRKIINAMPGGLDDKIGWT